MIHGYMYTSMFKIDFRINNFVRADIEFSKSAENNMFTD